MVRGRRADQGRGRAAGQVAAGFDRVGVVVAPLHRHPGARLRQGPPLARARLRPAGAGARPRPLPGLARAAVQGSRREPYQVTIAIEAYGEARWEVVEREIAGQAVHRAKLLAGEMPVEIEEVFAALGLALFPRDLDMSCSCPDWGFPCKHLSAVLYLLAESFDDDPFLVLAWRGAHPGAVARIAGGGAGGRSPGRRGRAVRRAAGRLLRAGGGDPPAGAARDALSRAAAPAVPAAGGARADARSRLRTDGGGILSGPMTRA